MNTLLERLRFHFIRGADHVFPSPALHGLVAMTTNVESHLRFAFRRGVPAQLPLPGCFPERPRPSRRHMHAQARVSEALEYLPDRLGHPAWIKRCTFVGLDSLHRARQNGRPVILAFCHAGPYRLMRFWLRAAGIPACTVVRGKAEQRSPMRRRQDRLSPFAEIPTALYPDQLRNIINHLTAGYPILMAFDGLLGKHVHVPLCEGWTLRMATGPFRLAGNHGAMVFPCMLVDEGRWQYRFHIGRPVPEEYLATEEAFMDAGKHVVREIWPLLRDNPSQCPDFFLERIEPESPRANIQAA